MVPSCGRRLSDMKTALYQMWQHGRLVYMMEACPQHSSTAGAHAPPRSRPPGRAPPLSHSATQDKQTGAGGISQKNTQRSRPPGHAPPRRSCASLPCWCSRRPPARRTTWPGQRRPETAAPPRPAGCRPARSRWTWWRRWSAAHWPGLRRQGAVVGVSCWRHEEMIIGVSPVDARERLSLVQVAVGVLWGWQRHSSHWCKPQRVLLLLLLPQVLPLLLPLPPPQLLLPSAPAAGQQQSSARSHGTASSGQLQQPRSAASQQPQGPAVVAPWAMLQGRGSASSHIAPQARPCSHPAHLWQRTWPY